MERTKVRVADLYVSIGMPCGQSLPWQTSMSLAHTTAELGRLGVQTHFSVIAGNANVFAARDAVLDCFLRSDAKQLFWIDSDMKWTPEQFMRLLVLSIKYPVVAATYPTKMGTPRMVVKHPDLVNFEINEDGLIKVESLGLGFTCVQRHVMERLVVGKPMLYDEIADREYASVFYQDWAESRTKSGRINRRGEDTNFFKDVRTLGYDVLLDPTIMLGHVGNKSFEGDPVKGLGLEHVYRSQE